MAFEGEDARRWSMIDAPALPPGVDFITKSPNGPFIDTGINVIPEMRGRVYLSIETIKEMAEIAGLLDSKNAQEKSLYDLEIYNNGYKDGLRDGEELIGKLTTTISRLSADNYASILRDVETIESITAESANESGKSGSDSKNVQGTSSGKRKSGGKAVAASSVKGPNDVSSISGNDDLFKL